MSGMAVNVSNAVKSAMKNMIGMVVSVGGVELS
jgi:hypothetical protein